MYTALLVDDEQSVLNTLVSDISWEHLGVSSLLTAANGEQALSLLETNQVDLLITDICMPRLDGMELLSVVHERYPNTHCILLTAYSEFEYARRALRLGVEDYLLKPFVQEELENIIERALDNIYSKHQNREHLFRNNILTRWANGSISSEELNDRAGIINVNTFFASYCVLCTIERGEKHVASAFIRRYGKSLPHSWGAYSFFDDKNRCCLIIGGNDLTIEEIEQSISNVFTNDMSLKQMIISVGSVVNSSEKLAESYHISSNLLELANFAELKSPILTSSTINALTNDALTSEINSIFLIADTDQREAGFHALAERVAQTEAADSPLLSQLVHSLIQIFSQEFPTKPGVQKQIYNHIMLFNQVPNPENSDLAIFELLQYSYLLYRDYFNQLTPVVQEAINYIRSNYTSGPSIKEFCTKNRMNTCYLGFIFKKETGMFFNNYLSQYRICCALQLLQETNLQINEIAQKTGFSSSSYFISCFKKQLGISPIKYRTLNH